MFNRALIVLVFILFFTSCKKEYKSNSLKIEKISPYVYKHTSFLNTKSYGKVGCNGIIVVDKNEAIIFDTPINDETSKELINWVKNDLGCVIKTVVPTHFHIDCLGGLDEFHKNGISSFSSEATISLLKDKKKNRPQKTFKTSKDFFVGEQKIIVSFFGEGHTKDNIIAYLPSNKVLFGGCLIKALNAKKGNLKDANENEWATSVEKIKKEYPNINIVVPGHGKEGNSKLLDYTIQLFKK